MKKHEDIKAIARVIQLLGFLAFLYSFVLADSVSNGGPLVIYGIVIFVWMYAIGGALLVLLDIAKSVRVSAIAALEQEDRRKEKSKPSSNGKALGLKRLNPDKKRNVS